MNTTDPIADLLTRIRNSVKARKADCVIPASKEKESILKILKEAGYIKNYVRQEKKPQDDLVVIHKYVGKTNAPVFHSLKRVSKPGRRVYKGYQEIKPVLDGVGLSIVSTPKGIMADTDARKNKVGGEILCEIW
ncbi:MAG: 30S ribosomal protein S8 [Deltaproteobacteria bacterium]|nr:30S ribosomal protein S8 [Deltaproteobacteria bacterium]